MAGDGPILLGTERVSGGNLRATYSLKAGTRVHVFVLPEAYAAGSLANARDQVRGWFPLAGSSPFTPEVPSA
jgi:hypothetical protein